MRPVASPPPAAAAIVEVAEASASDNVLNGRATSASDLRKFRGNTFGRQTRRHSPAPREEGGRDRL